MVSDFNKDQEGLFDSTITKHIFDSKNVPIDKIFCLDWIKEDNQGLVNDMKNGTLIDEKEFEKMKMEVSDSEINLFDNDFYQN